MIDLSVIAPCFNEEGNIPQLVSRLLSVFERRSIDGEIVLVDDGSMDGTGPMIDALASRHPCVMAVHHPKNRGLAAAWDTGLEHARGAYVCFIDADLQNPPEEVWRLYREITQSRADVVQGVRSAIGRLKDSRYVASRVLNVMLNVAFGMSATDNKSGFVMALRETMADVLRRRFHYRYSHVFVAVAAHARGYTCREVETLFQSRHAGASFIKRWPVRLIVDVCFEIAKAIVEFRLSPQRIDALDDFVGIEVRAPHMREGRWQRLVRSMYFSIQALRGPLVTRRVRRMYRALMNTQWLTPSEMGQLQEHRLRRIIRHAYYHVPYYHEVCERLRVRPEQIQTIADLGKLPMLSKQDIKDNLYFDLFADNHRKRELQKVDAFGQDGAPLDIYVDRMQLEMRLASAVRAVAWTSWRDIDRHAALRRPINAGAFRETLLHKVDSWLERYLGRSSRDSIDWYGNLELSGIAFECEARAGLHVASESFIVEIVNGERPAGPGEEGDIIVTDLNGFGVPLIRFRTGDRAKAIEHTRCGCGRGLPRLRGIRRHSTATDRDRSDRLPQIEVA
jgi:phenylacetate-CoA ligase